MQPQFKVCGRCGQPAKLDAVECLQCRHAFRLDLGAARRMAHGLPPQITPPKPTRGLSPAPFVILACLALLGVSIIGWLHSLARDRDEWQNVSPMFGQAADPQGKDDSATIPIRNGMTFEEVRSRMGEPTEISSSVANPGNQSWTYPNTFLIFKDGKVFNGDNPEQIENDESRISDYGTSPRSREKDVYVHEYTRHNRNGSTSRVRSHYRSR